jgi:Cu(I)/Ag(I) efflux system membrane fusion protein
VDDKRVPSASDSPASPDSDHELTPVQHGPPLRSAWQELKLLAEVVEVRLRFVVVLVAVGLFIGYWDTIKNHWDKWTRPTAVAIKNLPADQEFYCPMHPQVVRPSLEPNGDVPKCPICGMPLSIRKKGEAAPLPPGITGRVQLSPERVQLAGVKTVRIGYQPLVRQLTTLGNVTYDESRLSRVVSRVSGYIEKLYVDKTFVKVSQGDPLAEIYSPDLFSAAQELVLATRRGEALADLAASARQRLKLLGVSPQEIDAIGTSTQAVPRVVIRSPRSGYVIGKAVVAGAKVDEGMTLLEVADLSVVWIEADVYEKDIALLRVGQKVGAAMESTPETLSGRVALIYPQMDAATRTTRVRFEVENPRGDLRPGMYATVRISTALGAVEPLLAAARPSPAQVIATGTGPAAPKAGEVLAVPELAVIDTGSKQIVYAERKPGLFEGVEVQLGPRCGEFYPVLKGLQAGDRVAAAGAFLVDAETRLNPAAAATFFGASGGPAARSGTGSPSAPGGSSPEQEAVKPDRTAESPTPATKNIHLSDKELANIAKLPAEDQVLARAQRLCPVTEYPLGAMGVPQKITLNGQTVFLCCAGCDRKARKKAGEMLRKVAQFKAESAPPRGGDHD